MIGIANGVSANRGRQRAVTQDQLHVLHRDEEEAEVGEEQERDADRAGGEVRFARTSGHPAAGAAAAIRTAAKTTASATPADMQPQTIGCVHPRTGASTTPNTNTATARADEYRTDPVHGGGRLVARGADRAASERTCTSPAAAKRVEDRLPREEVQQQSSSHETDNGAGTGHAGPDPNGLVAFGLRKRSGQ